MSIFKVERYLVRPERSANYHQVIEKWKAYIKKNKEECRELKSWRLFSEVIGGNVNGFIEMWEFESLADYEKVMNRIMQDKEFQTLAQMFYKECLLPATYSVSIWNSLA
jgi:hypothetical protein